MYLKVGNSGLELSANFKSHKVVAAVKIVTIQHDTFDNQPVTRLIFDGIPSVTIADSELRNKPQPEAGMYLVAYGDENNYFSFSPAKQFEEGYTSIGSPLLTGFGWALKQMQNGSRVARRGWNGKGMFLFIVPGSNFTVNRAPLLGIYPEGTPIEYRSHIDMKTADGSVVPWVASQTDLLALDWEIAD